MESVDDECERCRALQRSCEPCALDEYTRRQFAEMRRVDHGFGLELDEEDRESGSMRSVGEEE